MTDQIKGDIAYRGDVATGYDEARMLEPLWDVEHNFVKRLVSSLPPTTVVLDIPFGTGRFADLYIEKNLCVIAADVSVDMLHVARSKVSNRENSLEFMQGDACSLPLADDVADIVICFRLAHLVSPEALCQILHELMRVVKYRLVLEIVAVDLGFPFDVKRRCISLLRYVSQTMRRAPSRTHQPWENILSYVHSVRTLSTCFDSLGLYQTSAIRITDYNGWPVMVYLLDKRKSP